MLAREFLIKHVEILYMHLPQTKAYTAILESSMSGKTFTLILKTTIWLRTYAYIGAFIYL